MEAAHWRGFLSSCELHPDEHVTGFCASCLRERLTTLDPSATSIARLPSSFSIHPKNRPQLRRCKSFAAAAAATVTSVAVEPRRNSCDARVRSTLRSLFHQDDRRESSLLSLKHVFEDVRPMKEHIDLDLQSRSKKSSSRDLKEIAGSFWLAATVFSRKLQKWARRQKPDKRGTNRGLSSALRKERTRAILKSARRFRDTQSEIAVDAFGRRSCDIAPRFSLDDSWEANLISNSKSLPSSRLQMDAVQRFDGLFLVEEDSDSILPGCSAHTRDYYSDSFGRRRRSADLSGSNRRKSDSDNLFHWSSRLEGESRIWGSNSLREICDSTFSIPISVPPAKKSRLWSIWGFIHGRQGIKAAGSHMTERSFSETWPELEATARRSLSANSGLSNTVQSKKKKKKKKKQGRDFDKCRSARYSPGHFDNGLLRFYLTPLRGKRRGGMLGRGKFSSPQQSFPSSVLRLY